MRPAVAGSRPIRQRMVVVLPTPLRPIRLTISPLPIAMSMPRSTGVLP